MATEVQQERIIDGEAVTVDGLVRKGYFEVEGVTWWWKANGPSFYNNAGQFKLRRVNDGVVFYGQTQAYTGGLFISGVRGELQGGLAVYADSLVALGRLAADPEFRRVVDAVGRWRAEYREEGDG